ncbi:hypothetical protein EG328_001836 [Venturia inaequalis]|uniref:Uncharacterized protein n=1 Tax=Venturia inaequalis TaxID=5025 RepID=A0A8H3VRT7_VENIN|nr:hypothetical protein EG328_001836 [Venturia inaequalis]KAE9992910.1 hypothetical protein EG327_007218 [Venturia inaequalis]
MSSDTPEPTFSPVHAANESPPPGRPSVAGDNSLSGRVRRASIKALEADMPLGFLSAAGSAVSKAPSLADIRRGSFTTDGYNNERAAEYEQHRRSSNASSTEGRGMGDRTGSGFGVTSTGRRKRENTIGSVNDQQYPLTEEPSILTTEGSRTGVVAPVNTSVEKESTSTEVSAKQPGAPVSAYPNGYTPPPKLPFKTSFKIGFVAFCKWCMTPLGFAIFIYGLNVVAWGGMLFLLLCNASPAMCKPTCNDINSPRRIWIEIDSQILNALFCVTGFGLVPWRFRDLYWLMVYRLGIRGKSKEQRMVGLRRLAGIHRNWFRLEGSQNWEQEDGSNLEANPAVPLPIAKKLDPPLTGERAPPTALWKMDYVIWMNCWNTFLQTVLCGFMWGLNRYDRPSWSTGLFVALACIVAALGGLMMFTEGKKVKKVEGIPTPVSQRLEDSEAIVLEGEKKMGRKEKKSGEGNTVLEQEVSRA